jgi:hypothetical protein
MHDPEQPVTRQPRPPLLVDIDASRLEHLRERQDHCCQDASDKNLQAGFAACFASRDPTRSYVISSARWSQRNLGRCAATFELTLGSAPTLSIGYFHVHLAAIYPPRVIMLLQTSEPQDASLAFHQETLVSSPRYLSKCLFWIVYPFRMVFKQGTKSTAGQNTVALVDATSI